MLVGIHPELIYTIEDVDADNKIENEEAIYIFQNIAGFR